MSSNFKPQYHSISPLDGRYASKLTIIGDIFSEFSLVKQRLFVEIQYLLALAKKIDQIKISNRQENQLLALYSNFSDGDFERIQEIEKVTRHDVKAIEYFIVEKINDSQLSSWIHWGLTSEDTNNLAQGTQLQAGRKVLVSCSLEMLRMLLELSDSGRSEVMLARTHGQPAVPTTLGKELLVHTKSLFELTVKLDQFEFSGKLSGAVGTLAGHHLVFPKINWQKFSEEFVTSLDLKQETLTTQVMTPQNLMSWFGLISDYSQLLNGIVKDIWWYISYGYFDQEVKTKQIGSSTMPQKVNPIMFENAEGNSEISSSLARVISDKLAYSRLQRDLSDSTVRRNIGVVFGHLYLAIDSAKKGLKALHINSVKMKSELEDHPEVLAEAVQLLLKANGNDNGYEVIKELTRGKNVNWREVVSDSQIPAKIKNQILNLTPEKYLGWTLEVVEAEIKKMREGIEVLIKN